METPQSSFECDCQEDSISVASASDKFDKCCSLQQNLSSEICKQASVIPNKSYLPWHDYFMSLCYLTAARSKDPNTKVGACIVDKENRVVSLGYNGMPRGIKDDDLPWGKVAAHSYETKYPYVCHAEMNAILNERHAALDDCSIYVSKFPCCECAKLIIQAGIKKVVFSELKPEPWEEQVPTRKMFSLAGVTCRKFIPSLHQLNLNVTDGIGSVSITK
ncbi:deoxycytidylate deaminase-like [Argiope bruennichi]|uniref:Probable deoxycytidylate deaminase n=1 Tax=Argiope bruennichi TaxID=94029 RepID=A0A8T0F8X2_ARGBR|nr:deoxycytidylate deaminase-like [Argiope bruennichi]XP_055927790.1 deoxycytidylate deaminase-like [Argiope bruennichi]XP_055927791.1 deoxycytidylate deaminase-like [Argiope bruennichi]XP_055927792.1 deoxycytidylate deaminase-like [Argiope bruennichi]KAF8785869.1 Deoxycytidylate deaminase like protein [Argiope bruennichi]